MAAKTGLIEFIDRDSSNFKIKVEGKLEEYRSIKFYDFTSARRMMTRIVQNVETGKVFALVKGADSAIISRCIPRSLAHGSWSERDQGRVDLFDHEEISIFDRIELFASKGFRTLTFAIKELSSPNIDGVMT